MRIKDPAYINGLRQLLDDFGFAESLKKSRVLVSGASGMIGEVLVDLLMLANQLYDSKISITAMARNAERAEKCFAEYLNDGRFRFVAADVNCQIQEIGIYDYMIHAASNTHPYAYSQDPIGTILTNIVGTKNLLDYAAAHEIKRFVFLSSVEIYGENQSSADRFTEMECGYIDCNTVRAGYPEGKRVGESLCCAYEKQYGLDIVIPRLCRIYGPTMNWTDSKALSQFIRNAVRGEDIVLKSKGDQYYSYLYVLDAVSAILKIMLEGKSGEAYNVSSPNSDIHLKDLAEKLAGLAGSKVVYQLPDEIEQSGFSKATKALLDNGKLLKLGWREESTLDTGLAATVKALRSCYS